MARTTTEIELEIEEQAAALWATVLRFDIEQHLLGHRHARRAGNLASRALDQDVQLRALRTELIEAGR